MSTPRDNIQTIAITGFSVIALLMISIAAIALYEMQRINERASDLATHSQQRIAAINAMRDAVSRRVASLRLIAANPDPFERDREQMRFIAQGGAFIVAREFFESLSTSGEERAVLARFKKVLGGLATNSIDTVQKILGSGDREQVTEALAHAIEERQRLLDSLDRLQTNENQRAKRLALKNQHDYQDSYKLFLLITAFAVGLAGLTTHAIVLRAAEHQRRLRRQASHDGLTDLLNRQGFETAVARALERSASIQAAILYLDLDQFKLINETAGHHAGDDLLRELATRMKKEIRATDIFARLGGDEFAVFLNHCPPDRVLKIANKLRRVVKRYQHDWDDHLFEVGVSIGAIAIHDNSSCVEQLLAAADKACYMAKERGRNQVYFVHENDAALEKRSDEMQRVNQINDALRNNRFILYHQPIVATRPNSEVSMIEVLVRMIGPDGEIIPPGLFLPAAERFDLMTDIDKWVVRHSLTWMHHNLKRTDPLEVSINICAKSASNKAFQRYVMHLISRFDINPASICFEITETMAMSDFAGARSMIDALGQLGVRFAIDDFGSGQASFEYLKKLDVHYLKIDGAFVRHMEKDQIDCEIVKSMNQIGQVMGKKTIAEFVENDNIRRMLQQLGVNYVQGYGIAEPRPLDEYGRIQHVDPPRVDNDSEMNDSVLTPA